MIRNDAVRFLRSRIEVLDREIAIRRREQAALTFALADMEKEEARRAEEAAARAAKVAQAAGETTAGEAT